MNIGKYHEAKALYDAILFRYNKIPDRLGRLNEMKVWNNRLEYCLQLLAAQIHTPGDTLVKQIQEWRIFMNCTVF